MKSKKGQAIRRARAALLALLASMTFDAGAAQWFVQSGGASVAFSPQFLTINAGDSVTFVNLGGNHNVVADDGSFRCAHGCDNDGHGGNGHSSSDLWIATVQFSQPGTVGYFCEPHGAPGTGMYGSIEVLAPKPPVAVPSTGLWQGAALAAVLTAAALLQLRRRSARAVRRDAGRVRQARLR